MITRNNPEGQLTFNATEPGILPAKPIKRRMSKRDMTNYLRDSIGLPPEEPPNVTPESIVFTRRDNGYLGFSIPSHNMTPDQWKRFMYSEKWVELTFGSFLRNELNANPKHQVSCSAGIIDILTDDFVYEVKTYLTRSRMFEAAGQLLAYGSALGMERRYAMVGRWLPETKTMVTAMNDIGVYVMPWQIAPFARSIAESMSIDDE